MNKVFRLGLSVALNVIPAAPVFAQSGVFPFLSPNGTGANPATVRQALGLPMVPAWASASLEGFPSSVANAVLPQQGNLWATFYVSPSGSDSNPCTSIATACATIQAALNLATQPGSIVSVLPGKVYGGGSGTTPPIVFSHSGSGAGTGPGGTCSAPIVVEGYPFAHDRPIVAGVKGANNAGAITNSGIVSCLVVNRLELAGWAGDLSWGLAGNNAAQSNIFSATYSDYAIDFIGNVANPVHHIIVANSYVHDFPGGGIGTTYADYVSILNNHAENTSSLSPLEGSCISMYQNQNADVTQTTHNVIMGNFTNGCVNLVPNRIAGSGSVITTLSATAPTGNTQISVTSTAGVGYVQSIVDGSFGGCIPPQTQVAYYGPGYIGLTNPTTCPLTSGNPVVLGYQTDGHGIIVDNTRCTQTPGCTTGATARTLVMNNIATGNGGSGIQIGPQADHVDVVFNTVYLNQVNAYETGNGNGDGELNDQYTIDTNIFNNIIVASGTVVSLRDQSTSTTAWGSNLVIGGVPGNQGFTIPGTGNIFKDPQFLAPSTNYFTSNFQIPQTSPAYGVGSTAWTRVFDYAGSPGVTSGPPSLGAYEPR